MRIVLPLIALVAAAAAISAFAASSSGVPRVGCDQVIAEAQSGHADGYRVVLEVVSVPPPRLSRAIRIRNTRWPYWLKAGLVIHASRRSVTVSVPKARRRSAAITWGNTTGIVSGLRFAACPSPPHVWNAYAGGFYLRSRTACVPLVFQVGSRRRLVRFGIGRRC